MSKSVLHSFIIKNRIRITRIYFLSIFLFILFSNPILKEDFLLEYFLESLGVLFVTIAALGRLWSLVYISGYKNKDVIQIGPYSMVRNPLYFFSLIGTLGIGLLSGSIIITILLLLFFVVYYPFVVIAEEKNLENIFGDDYKQYKEKVPRFIPNTNLYYDDKSYNINLNSYKKEFLDAIWFILSIAVFQLIDILNTHGIVPTFFNVI